MRNAIRNLLACGILAVVVLGCSSSGPGSATDRRGASTSAPSSTAGGPSGSAGTTGPNASDNAGTLVAQNPSGGAAGSAAGAQMQPPPPNTAISHDPISIDDCGNDNSAGLMPADVQKLKAGGGSPGALKWLYPYDGTVFPRGMLAPDLMWDGPMPDAVYVHIKSKIFEYWACLKPTDPGRITLAQDVWDKAGQRSYGRGDDYLIELSVLSQGSVVGPVTSHIEIAQAAVKGSIYYNTYRSNLLSGMAADGGVPGITGIPGGPSGTLNGLVVRIPAGGHAEVFGQTDCSGCHSVSADGSLLLAQSVANGALSYKLVANGPTPMPMMAGSSGSWVALYPDGSAALSMSSVIDVARAGIFGGLSGATDATLFDTTTGKAIPSTGIPTGALMPFFSPDGTYLVFNDYAIDQAHGIALMNYDTKTNSATNYTVLFKEDANSSTRPAWPFVLPDDHGVVFIRTDDGDFTGGGVGVDSDIQAGAAAPFAELSIIDVASKTVTLLAKAMGYNTPQDAATDTTYLPFGMEDLHHAYYPTVSPVSSGGYFWVFFDSVRHYGGLGIQRQLWGAALDISADGTYTHDPSHPAFYVTGQEFGTGNHRAFAALDPCHQDGDKCTSGIDCCGGFCAIDSSDELVQPVGTCSPQKMMCANKDERCKTASDCCPAPDGQPPYSCIAGFCAYIMAPN